MQISDDNRREIRVAGFGGQGIVLSAVILGKAASIYMGKKAAVMQSYGPESRGGACSGAIVIDEETVDYPYATRPDVLLFLSQEAYAKYRKTLKKGGLMIVEEDLVELAGDDGDAIIYKVPATRMAENLGKKIVANIIMLGALVGISDIITFSAIKQSVLSMVPPKTLKINQEAVEQGYEYGNKIKKAVEVST
ncbi:MAG: 2-oxoacid:acceptor oxidoreductase family protein [Candidatus Eremiobacteraeota bacterium]|nr:2-oxoacid:acceptor oxidoreductase family protein [Candidatus Eremiobacteraeota bacterium]